MENKKYPEIDFLANITGGKKKMWLNQNRPMIIWYRSLFGDAATKELFHLTHDTLQRLIKHEPKPRNFELAKPDKALAMAGIALAEAREVKRRIVQLEEAYSTFTDTIGKQVGNDFGQAVSLLLQSSLNMPPELAASNSPDPLNVDSLLAEGRKCQERLYSRKGDDKTEPKMELPKALVKAREIYLSAHPLAE